jgi:hypothetical protein
MKKYFFIAVLILISLMIYSMFAEENIHDLEGDFKEVAYTRNENNTGPVVRIYAFTVADTLWTSIKEHTNLLPHTKYGTTEAYYFLKTDDLPTKVTLKDPKIAAEVQPYCIAKAVKDGMGTISLETYPFLKK